MDINSAKLFFEFILNKSQSGETLSIPQFNLLAQRAQMELFEKFYQIFEDTQDITDSLHEFLKPVVLNVDSSTGQIPYPDDYIHSASVRVIYWKNNESVERMVKQIKNADWGNTVASTIVTPTLKRPVMTYYDTYLQFAPKNVGSIRLDYFRQPKNPVWAYTMINNRPVFDDVNSVNWEFPDNTHNLLIMNMASMMGINLRENDLMQYSEMQKQEQKIN